MDHEHARCLKRPRSWLSIGLLRIGRAIVRPYRSSDSITRYCSWRRKHGEGAPCQSTLLLPCRREDYPGWQTTVGTAMRRPYRCGNEAARLTGLHLNFRRLLLCFRALGQGHREYPIFKAGRDLVGVDTLRAEAAFAPVVAWAIARATLTRSFAAGGHKRVRSSQNSNGLDSLIVRSGGSSDLNASTSNSARCRSDHRASGWSGSTHRSGATRAGCSKRANCLLRFTAGSPKLRYARSERGQGAA